LRWFFFVQETATATIAFAQVRQQPTLVQNDERAGRALRPRLGAGQGRRRRTDWPDPLREHDCRLVFRLQAQAFDRPGLRKFARRRDRR